MNLKERLLDASFQDDTDGNLLQEARDRIIELEESKNYHLKNGLNNQMKTLNIFLYRAQHGTLVKRTVNKQHR